MSFAEADRAAGWLQLDSIHNSGIIFCRSQRLHHQRLPGLQRIDRGWSGPVNRNELRFRGPILPGSTLEVKSGSALLPEEERLLVLWQDNGSIIVSTEDDHWNHQITNFCAGPVMKIIRPGAETVVWELPADYLYIAGQQLPGDKAPTRNA